MATNEIGNFDQVSIGDISAYIKNLRFKSVAFGGVDRDSALAAIQEIYHMFSSMIDDLQAQLDAQAAENSAMRKRQAPLEAELSQLKTEKDKLTNAIRQQMENAEKHVASEKSVSAELEDTKLKLHAMEKEMASMHRTYQREVELAKAGAAEHGETLEEIYLDARKSRTQMLEQAQRESDELMQRTENAAAALKRAAEKEADQLRAETAKEIDGLKADAARIVADAEEKAAEIARASEEAAEKCEDEYRAREEEARLLVENAEREGQRIIDEAKLSYQRERRKYDELLVQLGSVRAKTVQDIRGDIDKLNELVFGMAGRGVETDMFNFAGLPDINDDDNGAEVCESEDVQ